MQKLAENVPLGRYQVGALCVQIEEVRARLPGVEIHDLSTQFSRHELALHEAGHVVYTLVAGGFVWLAYIGTHTSTFGTHPAGLVVASFGRLKNLTDLGASTRRKTAIFAWAGAVAQGTAGIGPNDASLFLEAADGLQVDPQQLLVEARREASVVLAEHRPLLLALAELIDKHGTADAIQILHTARRIEPGVGRLPNLFDIAAWLIVRGGLVKNYGKKPLQPLENV